MLRKILPLALLACHAVAVQAEDQVTYYREGQRIDPQGVAAVLARPTRSIRLLVQDPANSAALASTAPDEPTAARPAVAPDPSRAEGLAQADAADARPADGAVLALAVRFGFDSADIQPAALAQLDAMAEGMRLLPADQAVQIEGHTDARGAQAYNVELSRRRAEAVKRYLVDVHGLDAARLKTVGFGMFRPLPGSEPSDARNRRVQFRGVSLHVASAAGYSRPLR